MKTIKLLTLSALCLLALQGCKKGEDDAILSLKTRNARITGEWKLETAYGQSTHTYQYGDMKEESKYVNTYANGESITSGDYQDTTQYTMTLNIEKGGTMTLEYVSEEETNSSTTTWAWLNNTKRKIGIEIDSDQFNIARLTNSELVIELISSSENKYLGGDLSAHSQSDVLSFVKQK